MVLTGFPEILYKDGFWWLVWVFLLVAIYVAKRRGRPPFPRVGRFFDTHSKGITIATDVGWILLLVLWFLFPLWAIKDLLGAQSQPQPLRQLWLPTAWAMLFTSLTAWTGIAGLFVGLLSLFQTNLTKIKRILLLLLCLLPVVFTVLHILALIDANKSPWLAVQTCLFWSFAGWVVNAPAIFTGKHLSRFLRDIVRKIKPVPAEQQD